MSQKKNTISRRRFLSASTGAAMGAACLPLLGGRT